MNQEQFPSKYNWLAIAPAAIAAIMYGISSLASAFNTDDLSSGFQYSFIMLICGGILTTAAVIILYVVQFRFIKRAYPAKQLWVQLLLICGSMMGIVMGGLVGDLSGAAAFKDSPDPMMVLFIALYCLPLVITVMYGCVLSNLLFIKTKGTTTWLKVINTILYWLVWIAVAGVSYFAYAIAYDSHDPSSE